MSVTAEEGSKEARLARTSSATTSTTGARSVGRLALPSFPEATEGLHRHSSFNKLRPTSSLLVVCAPPSEISGALPQQVDEDYGQGDVCGVASPTTYFLVLRRGALCPEGTQDFLVVEIDATCGGLHLGNVTIGVDLFAFRDDALESIRARAAGVVEHMTSSAAGRECASAIEMRVVAEFMAFAGAFVERGALHMLLIFDAECVASLPLAEGVEEREACDVMRVLRAGWRSIRLSLQHGVLRELSCVGPMHSAPASCEASSRGARAQRPPSLSGSDSHDDALGDSDGWPSLSSWVNGGGSAEACSSPALTSREFAFVPASAELFSVGGGDTTPATRPPLQGHERDSHATDDAPQTRPQRVEDSLYFIMGTTTTTTSREVLVPDLSRQWPFTAPPRVNTVCSGGNRELSSGAFLRALCESTNAGGGAPQSALRLVDHEELQACADADANEFLWNRALISFSSRFNVGDWCAHLIKGVVQVREAALPEFSAAPAMGPCDDAPPSTLTSASSCGINNTAAPVVVERVGGHDSLCSTVSSKEAAAAAAAANKRTLLITRRSTTLIAHHHHPSRQPSELAVFDIGEDEHELLVLKGGASPRREDEQQHDSDEQEGRGRKAFNSPLLSPRLQQCWRTGLLPTKQQLECHQIPSTSRWFSPFDQTPAALSPLAAHFAAIGQRLQGCLRFHLIAAEDVDGEAEGASAAGQLRHVEPMWMSLEELLVSVVGDSNPPAPSCIVLLRWLLLQRGGSTTRGTERLAAHLNAHFDACATFSCGLVFDRNHHSAEAHSTSTREPLHVHYLPRSATPAQKVLAALHQAVGALQRIVQKEGLPTTSKAYHISLLCSLFVCVLEATCGVRSQRAGALLKGFLSSVGHVFENDSQLTSVEPNGEAPSESRRQRLVGVLADAHQAFHSEIVIGVAVVLGLQRAPASSGAAAHAANLLDELHALPQAGVATFLRDAPQLLSHPASGASVIKQVLRRAPGPTPGKASVHLHGDQLGVSLQPLLHPSCPGITLPAETEAQAVKVLIVLPQLSVITHIAFHVAATSGDASSAAGSAAAARASDTKDTIAAFASPIEVTVAAGPFLDANHSKPPRLLMHREQLPLAVKRNSGGGANPPCNTAAIVYPVDYYDRWEEPAPFVPFHTTEAVVAQFITIEFGASGCTELALRPIMVMGFPIQHAPRWIPLPFEKAGFQSAAGAMSQFMQTLSEHIPTVEALASANTAARQRMARSESKKFPLAQSQQRQELKGSFAWSSSSPSPPVRAPALSNAPASPLKSLFAAAMSSPSLSRHTPSPAHHRETPESADCRRSPGDGSPSSPQCMRGPAADGGPIAESVLEALRKGPLAAASVLRELVPAHDTRHCSSSPSLHSRSLSPASFAAKSPLMLPVLQEEVERLNRPGTSPTLAALLLMEARRLRDRISIVDRNNIYSRTGVPLWCMNPHYVVFPTLTQNEVPPPVRPSSTSVSAGAARDTSLLSVQRSGAAAKPQVDVEPAQDQKRCDLCQGRFGWLGKKFQCRSCRRSFCKKCVAEGPRPMYAEGLLTSSVEMCIRCAESSDEIARALAHTRELASSLGMLDERIVMPQLPWMLAPFSIRLPCRSGRSSPAAAQHHSVSDRGQCRVLAEPLMFITLPDGRTRRNGFDAILDPSFMAAVGEGWVCALPPNVSPQNTSLAAAAGAMDSLSASSVSGSPGVPRDVPHAPSPMPDSKRQNSSDVLSVVTVDVGLVFLQPVVITHAELVVRLAPTTEEPFECASWDAETADAHVCSVQLYCGPDLDAVAMVGALQVTQGTFFANTAKNKDNSNSAAPRCPARCVFSLANGDELLRRDMVRRGVIAAKVRFTGAQSWLSRLRFMSFNMDGCVCAVSALGRRTASGIVYRRPGGCAALPRRPLHELLPRQTDANIGIPGCFGGPQVRASKTLSFRQSFFASTTTLPDISSLPATGPLPPQAEGTRSSFRDQHTLTAFVGSDDSTTSSLFTLLDLPTGLRAPIRSITVDGFGASDVFPTSATFELLSPASICGMNVEHFHPSFMIPEVHAGIATAIRVSAYCHRQRLWDNVCVVTLPTALPWSQEAASPHPAAASAVHSPRALQNPHDASPGSTPTKTPSSQSVRNSARLLPVTQMTPQTASGGPRTPGRPSPRGRTSSNGHAAENFDAVGVHMAASSSSTEASVPAMTFSFPTSIHEISRIRVDVVRWRVTDHSAIHAKGAVYMGKFTFWHMPDPSVRRVLASRSYLSKHSSQRREGSPGAAF